MMSTLRSLFANGRELILVIAVLLILFVLFSPIPPVLLDFALLVNFGLSLTILLVALHVSKPVEFSTFPSLLLISTLLRLSLNIAATRLILTRAEAGDVIGSIGNFAVAGNFVVGLVVFFILVIVQYVVVTSGAQRVSEVAARFMLDSMPGQQMSIDADLNMGLIDQKEALRRRSALEKEASFYGAMDGASKFVKGDAIAGVIILLINIIAGWIIGVTQMGMGWSEALAHFSLLTIGDGIATQLPALIISTATGIIVTRSASDRELSTEVFRQLTATPRIPLLVCGLLILFLLLPGMPKWPILIVLGIGVLAWRRRRRTSAADAATMETDTEAPATPAPAALQAALGASLSAAWANGEALLMERIATLRDAQENALGLAFPPLSIVSDPRIGDFEYEVRLFGARYGAGEIKPNMTLAIAGEATRTKIAGAPTTDPAFGLPALWIETSRAAEARDAGYTIVDPTTVFMTHLSEVLRAQAPALLTRAATLRLLDAVRAREPGLIEELTPALLSASDVQRVLQNLLAEDISIAPMDLIAEHLVDLARAQKDPNQLSEALRQRLCYNICNKLRGRHRDLAVLSLDPRLENQMQAAISAHGQRDTLVLEPRLTEKLLRKLATFANEMMQQGREPVLLCGGDIRRPLRALTRRAIPKLSIISVNEIPTSIDLRSHAIVRADDPPPSQSDSSSAPQQPTFDIGIPDGYQLQ